jgi:murein DD-endopeptidase MepM/ murein hydrolase activator NlpD
MPEKKKYRYNPDTLSYEEVRVSNRQRIIRAVIVVLPSLVLIALGALMGATLLKSPTDLKVERENRMLRDEIEALNERIAFNEKVVTDLQHRDDNIYRVIFEADPFPAEVRQTEVTEEEEGEEEDISTLLARTNRRLERLEKKLYAQSRSFDEVQELVSRKRDMLAAIPSIQPISNKDLTQLSSGFGIRMHPIYKTPQMHTGVDFTAQPGTPIYCTGNGVVEESDWMGGYGKVVIVDHGFGFKTVYAHCQDLNVQKGQKVMRGQVIASVGNTGMSTGPHLHYEVRRRTVIDGQTVFEPVDPIHYFFQDLNPEEYQRIIELASHANQMLS